MKVKIDKELLNDAIRRTYNLKYIAPVEEYISLIWDEYNVQLANQAEDKKRFKGNDLMEIPGVRGFYYHDGIVEVNTNRGTKIYRIGNVTMETICKRVKKFLET